MFKATILAVILMFSAAINAKEKITESDNPNIKLGQAYDDNGVYWMRIWNFTQYRLFCRVRDAQTGYIYHSFYTPASGNKEVYPGRWEWVTGKSGWYLNPPNNFTWRCNYA